MRLKEIAYSDFELIDKQLKEGDNKWFGIIYDRHVSVVYNKCLTLVKNKEVAKDLTHDIFLKVFLKLSGFKGNSSFRTWLLSITYNDCIDSLKSTKKFIDISEDEVPGNLTDGDNNDQEIMSMEIKRLEKLLNKIPTDDKMILLMKYQDDLSIREIEQVLDIKESAVKMRISRAKAKLLNLYNIKYRHSIYYLNK